MRTDRRLSAAAKPPDPPPIITAVSTEPAPVFLQTGALFPALKACSVADRNTFPDRTDTYIQK